MASEALPSGAYTTHRPASFCTNCCRPLIGSGSRCSACGHVPGPETDAQLLGDPVAWVQAYEQQLQQQEQEVPDQQQLQQQASQGGTQGDAEQQARADCCGAAAAGGVLLATDARMLQHRCSLPPHPERYDLSHLPYLHLPAHTQINCIVTRPSLWPSTLPYSTGLRSF